MDEEHCLPEHSVGFYLSPPGVQWRSETLSTGRESVQRGLKQQLRTLGIFSTSNVKEHSEGESSFQWPDGWPCTWAFREKEAQHALVALQMNADWGVRSKGPGIPATEALLELLTSTTRRRQVVRVSIE